MKDKELSREELDVLFSFMRGSLIQRFGDRGRQTYKQIKSILTPIPPDKLGWLKQLIKNMKDSLKEPRRFYPTDRDVDNLQELYDKLKGEG